MRALLTAALIFSLSDLHASDQRAERECPTEWISNTTTQFEWTEIGPNTAVLTLNSEIIANLAFTSAGPVLHDRLHADNQFSSTTPTLVPITFTFWLDTNIQFDSLCSLSLRGIATHVTRPELLPQAKAWQQIGNSLTALASDNREAAASSAKCAFDLLSSAPRTSDSVLLEIAAYAIERLLDVADDRQADSVFQLTNALAPFRLPANHPSTLKFELARARLLSFSTSGRQALDLRRSLTAAIEVTFGNQSEESLLNQIRIANLELEIGYVTEAITTLQDLVDISRSAQGPANSTTFLATSSLANALALQGLDRDGLTLFSQLKEEVSAKYGSDDRRVITIEDQMARIRIRSGQLEAALDDASRVFLWRKGHLGFSSAETLESAWLLSRLYKDMGRFETARALIYAILSQIDSKNSYESMNLKRKTLGTLGNIEAGEGNLDTAEAIWRRVVESYSATLDNDSNDAASAYMNYALLAILNNQERLVCSKKGDSFFDLNRAVQHDRHLHAFANILNGLCLLGHLNTSNHPSSGIAEIENGWHELEAVDGASGDSTMYALSLLALANLRSGNRSLSKNYLRLMIGLAETERANAGIGSLTRDAWFSKWVTERNNIIGYRTLALLYAEDGQLDEALKISELSRDRRLHDRFMGRAELSAQLPPDVWGNLIEVSSRIDRLDESIALTSEIVDRVEIESQRIVAINELDRVKHDYLGHCNCSAIENDAERLRLQINSLARDTAVVSILHTDERWWGILLSRGRPLKMLHFDSIKNLKEVAHAWRTLLKGEPARVWLKADKELSFGFSRPDGAVGPYLTKEELGARLGRALMKPILEASPESRQFIIVADDDLTEVPFGALPVSGTSAIHRYSFIYSPSVKTYFWHSNSSMATHWDGDLFAMAVDRVAAVSRVGAEINISVPRDEAGSPLLDYVTKHPLGFAQREVERISGMFNSKRVKTLYGPEATKEALLGASRDGSLRRFRYAHFAAHSISFSDAPERSMIFLEERKYLRRSGYGLTAAELSNLEMNSELVVVSACSTATGRFEPGQGLLGLAFAALAAGNHAAILTLWPISDDLAETFMVRMYKFLTEGLAPVAALNTTQREFASSPDPRLRDPSIWAAFVLYGGR